MWTGNLRVSVALLVAQVCLLAMLQAAPWTVHGGRSVTLLHPAATCCPRFPECCAAASAAMATQPDP
uniref:Uncharacterized protein n=1 Tax=Oryza brachyantha TaxID=4533 RepID=J3L4X5_ORYBR